MPRVREILFVAGDPSGDMHAARVAHALRERNAPFALVGVGGDRMQAAGVRLLQHASALTVLGFAAVLGHVPTLWRLHRRLRARFASGDVAVAVLVDYGGFNLGFVAGAAKAAGVPVLYYITPQVWASRPGRIETLRRTVARAAVIFPFEETLLREHGVEATFVGHPLADAATTLPDRAEARRTLGLDPGRPVLALFPGSRKQEIARHVAPFVETARALEQRVPGLQVVVSHAPTVTLDASAIPYPLVRAPSLTLLRAADAALCKSGTTTLEAAVAGCPLVLAYRMGSIDYAIARRVVRIPDIGLVNIVAGRRIAPEFVQDDFVPGRVADALLPLLDAGAPERATMLAELAAVRAKLGEAGAAERVADMVLELAEKTPGPGPSGATAERGGR